MLIENFSAQFSEVKIASGVFFEDDRGSLKKSMHTKKINELMSDKRHLEAVLKKGKEKANIIAEENLKNIREKVGLI